MGAKKRAKCKAKKGGMVVVQGKSIKARKADHVKFEEDPYPTSPDGRVQFQSPESRRV